MVVGRNNEVVGLTGFSNKRCVGFCSGHKKVVVIKGWLYGGVVVWRGSTALAWFS